MSLLLKALKQAESANAGKATADELELEPGSTPSAKAREWVEPPGLLFGSSGLAPAPSASRRWRMPRLSLVPLAALLAMLIALAYGVYLYFALQPPLQRPTPASVVAPSTPQRASAGPTPASPPEQASPLAREIATLPTVTALPSAIPQAHPHPHAPAKQLARAPAMPAPASLPMFQANTQTAPLNRAYAAYQAGQLDEARQFYTEAAARERSVDALLGLAAIAAVQGRDDESVRLYREVLERDPGNAAAQAALLDLLGNTDSQATESRLKLLIEREPSAQLYQTLGNLYADQKRWIDAQAAYFESYRQAPGNADYAFNLAVSLDRLHQREAALVYYEKALNLGGAHRFDRAQAETRIRQIKPGQ